MTDTDFQYPLRLQKFLARAGVASRRGSEDLMTAGRVTVNGEVVTELGSRVDTSHDVVCVDGRRVEIAEHPVYLMLYKPRGYLTTMDDPQGRPCVRTLVPQKQYPGIFPVGRLDKDTTGLLLFTTNGDASQQLLHPSKHVWKHYVALVEGRITKENRCALEQGVELDDGMTQPAEVDFPERGSEAWDAVTPQGIRVGQTVVGLTIHEGRKHQVKRMLKAVGHEVVFLHRDGFGPLELKGVSYGSWRLLDEGEIASLEKIIQDRKRQ